jgi:hypothetical protein
MSAISGVVGSAGGGRAEHQPVGIRNMFLMAGTARPPSCQFPLRWASDGRLCALSQKIAQIFLPATPKAAHNLLGCKSYRVKMDDLQGESVYKGVKAILEELSKNVSDMDRARLSSAFSVFKGLAWSPAGLAWDGGCALALLTSGFALSIFEPPRDPIHFSWKHSFSISSSSVAAAQSLIDEDDVFDEVAMASVCSTCMGWFPELWWGSRAMLAVGSRNSLCVWQVTRDSSRPLRSHVTLGQPGPLWLLRPQRSYSAAAADSVGCLSWCSVGTSRACLVAACENGRIYVFWLSKGEQEGVITIRNMQVVRESCDSSPTPCGIAVAVRLVPPAVDFMASIAVGRSKSLDVLYVREDQSRVYACRSWDAHQLKITDLSARLTEQGALCIYSSSFDGLVIRWDMGWLLLHDKPPSQAVAKGLSHEHRSCGEHVKLELRPILGFDISPSGALLTVMIMQEPRIQETSESQTLNVLRHPHSLLAVTSLPGMEGGSAADWALLGGEDSPDQRRHLLLDYLWAISFQNLLKEARPIAEKVFSLSPDCSDLCMRLYHMALLVSRDVLVLKGSDGTCPNEADEAFVTKAIKLLRKRLMKNHCRRYIEKGEDASPLVRELSGLDGVQCSSPNGRFSGCAEKCVICDAVLPPLDMENPVATMCDRGHVNVRCMQSLRVCDMGGAICPVCEGQISGHLLTSGVSLFCTFCESHLDLDSPTIDSDGDDEEGQDEGMGYVVMDEEEEEEDGLCMTD